MREQDPAYRLVAFFSDYLVDIVMAEPSAEFHEPREAEMYDEATSDGSGIGSQHAKDKAAEEGRDAFAQGFTEVDGAVEGGHGQDRVLAYEAEEADDEQAAEEEFYAQEVEAIGEFV